MNEDKESKIILYGNGSIGKSSFLARLLKGTKGKKDNQNTFWVSSPKKETYKQSLFEIVGEIDDPASESSEKETDSSPSLSITVAPGSAPPEVIGELLARLSLLNRKMGGEGIEFTLEDIFTDQKTCAS